MLRFALILALSLLALPATAQDRLGWYSTWLGPEDLYNSRGVRLSSPGQVIQQDRANFHRFGIRHQGDEYDPFFDTQQARARIEGLYQTGPTNPGLAGAIMSGGFYALIEVYGYNGVPAFIVVYPGAG